MRFSLKTFLALFTTASVSCAALAFAGPLWAAAFFTASFLMIVGAIVAAVLQRGPERAFWVGFALLGGGYLLATVIDLPRQERRWDPALFTTQIMIQFQAYMETQRPQGVNANVGQPYYATRGFPRRNIHLPSDSVSFVRIGHALFTFILALLGGIWGRRCYLRSEAVTKGNVP